jgi:GT2 family glycosyltransferase
VKIAENGFNAIRVYTVPPRWFLDAAQRHGLRVMVGLPWEQHVAFLDDPRRVRSIEKRVRAGVRVCAGHPAVLAYAIGNEIPAPIVRWHGSRRVERFLERLCESAKAEDPGGLVTYVNYPSTEYLRLPFVDLFCFNVYLETQKTYDSYLARLHNLAGDRPLIMAEIGLDSRRNGEAGQACSLEWQVRTAMASGCAGAFVFAWTDEWYRGGQDIEDWDFGLTTRTRQPKLALTAVREAFAEVPFPEQIAWPRVSVVVCTCNGSRTLRECLCGLCSLDYPNYEVIVVNDGSTDDSATIATQFGFRLITTENRGLSCARNTGLAAATGEIVAYLDDDTYPDPQWLKYLASTLLATKHAGVGGPNLPPPHDDLIAQCVANAPGGPNQVLLTDSIAEHIPGCNMAFWKQRLAAIGGFDPRFRVAGDDVDICWRIQEKGWTIGFNPAALVWHRRRNSIRAYWRQQRGYGRAEALLQEKWPQKYNLAGHAMWTGRLYGKDLAQVPRLVSRIYHGTWGSALFQTRYQVVPSAVSHLPAMPEWLLIILCLGFLSALGLLWSKLLWATPILTLAVGISLYQAGSSAARARFTAPGLSRVRLCGLRFVTFLLHLLQPVARLVGRTQQGLMSGRPHVPPKRAWPVRRAAQSWSEQWQAPRERLEDLQAFIRDEGGVVAPGGPCDRWDLEVQVGLLAAVRLLMTVEEHGRGRQLFRFRLAPHCTAVAWAGFMPLVALSIAAGLDQAWVVTAILGILSAVLVASWALECGSVMALVLRALNLVGADRRPARAHQSHSPVSRLSVRNILQK